VARGSSKLTPDRAAAATYTGSVDLSLVLLLFYFSGNSTDYKVHKNESVNWVTAVNRCLSYNASLAVFDDDFLQYFPSSALSESEQAWIGLVESRWRWLALGTSDEV